MVQKKFMEQPNINISIIEHISIFITISITNLIVDCLKFSLFVNI